MTTGIGGTDDTDMPTAATAKWLTLIGLIPMVGVVLFGVAGILGIRAFAHNNDCGFGGALVEAQACTHYSYALPITVGVLAILLVIGGGAFANYYAMRHVGLPLMASLRNRRAPESSESAGR